MKGELSNFMQLASVRRYTLTEGRAKGLDVIDCDNGKIRFLLNVSKALDIMQLYHEGQNVSFLSKNAYIAQNQPFLSRFEGGMLYTCGLDSIGSREGVDLHGTFHTTVAEVITARCDEGGITVEAIIKNTALFGRNLVMHRRIYSAIGSTELTLKDTLINEGYVKEDYCLLYHVNVGYPMLDVGGKIVADIESATPRNAWATEKQAEMLDITPALPAQEETCYFIKLKAPRVSYVNPAIGKTFTLEYSGETLPCFIEWKSMASGDYALGFEPSTTELDDRFTYRTLAAGESVDFTLKLSVTK